jgi:ABC-type xylose transport system permease subunit
MFELNQMNVNYYLRMGIVGIILALAVGIDCILREHQAV